eukprot:10186978-Alexandrium_andersonii.AAC.1
MAKQVGNPLPPPELTSTATQRGQEGANTTGRLRPNEPGPTSGAVTGLAAARRPQSHFEG